MSFFGSGPTGPAPMTVAKIEAEILTDMFNKYNLNIFFINCFLTYNCK